jgi:hypothetical protein
MQDEQYIVEGTNAGKWIFTSLAAGLYRVETKFTLITNATGDNVEKVEAKLVVGKYAGLAMVIDAEVETCESISNDQIGQGRMRRSVWSAVADGTTKVCTATDPSYRLNVSADDGGITMDDSKILAFGTLSVADGQDVMVDIAMESATIHAFENLDDDYSGMSDATLEVDVVLYTAGDSSNKIASLPGPIRLMRSKLRGEADDDYNQDYGLRFTQATTGMFVFPNLAAGAYNIDVTFSVEVGVLIHKSGQKDD